MTTSIKQIEQLTKSHGDRMLFSDVTFGINEGDKIALIAKNGTGKTTLLSILAGRESADSGSVVFKNGLRVGYLEQTPVFAPEQTVLDVCFLNPDSSQCKAIAAYEAALNEAEGADLAGAMAEMDATSAWDFDDRIKQVLGKLGIHNLEQKIGSPDMVVLFTNTVSHRMVNCALNEAKRKNISVIRCHTSSAAALKQILEEHVG